MTVTSPLAFEALAEDSVFCKPLAVIVGVIPAILLPLASLRVRTILATVPSAFTGEEGRAKVVCVASTSPGIKMMSGPAFGVLEAKVTVVVFLSATLDLNVQFQALRVVIEVSAVQEVFPSMEPVTLRTTLGF